MSHPEGAVGHIDLSPGDDDGMFNGLDRGVHTVKRAVAFVSDLDVDSAAFSILSRQRKEEGEKKRGKKALSEREPYARWMRCSSK